MEFEDRKDWVPIIPIPKNIYLQDVGNYSYETINEGFIKSNPYLKYQMDDGSILEEDYCYLNAKNEVLGFVVRFMKEGKKRLPTLTYCQHSDGRQRWYWRGFPESYIYNLPNLIKNPEKSVLIVEGEKTCKSAQELFPHYCVITWYGGSSSISRVDWSILKGRKITLWPDADPIGRECMRILENLLPTYKVYSISTVEHNFNKASLPLGWDLADPLPLEWIGEGVIHNILENKRTVYIDYSQDSHAVNRELTL